MMHCLGDSLALGVAYELPRCITQATIGISAARFDATFAGVVGGATVISLGTNPGHADERHLRRIRSRISGEVIWLLPPARLRSVVLSIAVERHDRVVDVRSAGAWPPRVHPTAGGYATLARLVTKECAP